MRDLKMLIGKTLTSVTMKGYQSADGMRLLIFRTTQKDYEFWVDKAITPSYGYGFETRFYSPILAGKVTDVQVNLNMCSNYDDKFTGIIDAYIYLDNKPYAAIGISLSVTADSMDAFSKPYFLRIFYR